MRPFLRRNCDHFCVDTQFGSGLGCWSTEFGHLLLRAEVDAAECKGTCAVTMFVDVVTAYASITRCLIAQDCVSEELLTEKLVSQGFDRDFVVEIVREMADLWFWSDAGAVEHLKAMVNDWFTETWSSLEGSTQVLLHKQGCGAGNPAADLFFCIGFAKALRCCRRDLRILAA